ncbi:MAG: UvrD-helicase domain-containing protein [Anaerolineales bacterium]|nr:UvrD-helicase domain-containing protein [Anaerolineales bacterium]MBX3005320.1 UvrD-helicase domain-containing protein [Anaerolineales bacterium]MCW5838479.1 UvrD-helicase domain-containing protein [Anaerolineales bacterium]
MLDLAVGLNPQQQQALLASAGPVLVLAGPGSGKTRVLTHRIAYLISELGVNPYNILAVTFTNKAAKEMNTRVENLLGGRPRGLTLGTFHSICARLLRQEAEHLPVNQNFVIYDSDDQLAIVRQALKDLNIDEKMHRAGGVHASISAAKNELALPEDMPVNSYRDEVVARVYQRYQQALLANNAMDFDDLLLWTAYLLDTNPTVRQKYAQRYEHILVDEFQDTNQAQYSLLKHLASVHRNLYVVGDTDQSIYRWRGADYRNVIRFEEDYPDAQVILLEQNYRSTQRILDAAMAVIDRNPHRTRKQLFTQRGGGDKVIYQQTLNEQETGKFIVETIASRVAEGARLGDFAVMYRTNAQSRLIEEAFLYANLPYKLVGAQRFYGRREVKDVLCYLRLVFNPNDEVSLNRVINVPTRRIGIKGQAVLRTLALQHKTTPGDLLMQLGAAPEDPRFAPLPSPTAQAMAKFGTLLAHWHALAEAGSEPMQLMDRILHDVDYHGYLMADDGPDDEAQDRWDNVQELRRLAAEYSGKTLPEFLENIALVSDQDTLDEAAEVPTLLTLHAAKGLEFPTVFITGLNDGTLPHQRALDDPEEMQEERRLFYVGITRAKDQLILLHNMYKSSYGYAEGTLPSRFLDDLPDELVEGGNQTRREHPNRPDRWQNPRQPSAPILQPKFTPGMNVLHPTWGEGMVLNSRIQDDDELVDIFFQGVGLKKVMAAFANLQPLPKGK